MNDYKFLGIINGIYDYITFIRSYQDLLVDAAIREKIQKYTENDYNRLDTLFVYFSEEEHKLVITSVREEYTAGSEDTLLLTSINTFKSTIEVTNSTLQSLIILKFSERTTKELIFSEYLTSISDDSEYTYVY